MSHINQSPSQSPAYIPTRQSDVGSPLRRLRALPNGELKLTRTPCLCRFSLAYTARIALAAWMFGEGALFDGCLEVVLSLSCRWELCSGHMLAPPVAWVPSSSRCGWIRLLLENVLFSFSLSGLFMDTDYFRRLFGLPYFMPGSRPAIFYSISCSIVRLLHLLKL